MNDVQVTESSEIERVYRDAGERLWWALLAYTGDREVASDSAAEAFALAISTADTIRDPAAWIWRVAFRVATAYLREPTTAFEHPEATYELDDGVAEVIVALKKLPKRQRAVFILFYLDDSRPRRSPICSK
jgi:DNA-directed RNA polymerase specialized sigma24 family protein